MSDPRFVGSTLPKDIQWVTDTEPCQAAELQRCQEVILEVRGELEGKTVTFEGGLTLADKMPFLAHTRITPYITTVPGVTFIRPVTDAVGVTITVRSIQ